jgi:asparagine synthase (glutamine-hydrolysing)
VRNFNSDVRTFGIRFEEDGFDEGQYQSQMVSFLEAHHTEMQATNEEIGESLPHCLWHAEKPLLRTAPIPLLLLSEVVHRNGFKVVITGEGADEVFGGYNIFREAKVRRFCAKFPDSQNRGALIAQLYPYIFNNPRLKRTLQSFFAKGLAHQRDRPVLWVRAGQAKPPKGVWAGGQSPKSPVPGDGNLLEQLSAFFAG